MTDVIVRSYGGRNQQEAALRYAEDALVLAADGWAPTTIVWVADDWPSEAYVAAVILIIFLIGIVLLLVLGFIKPVRTLMVTYERRAQAAEAG